MILLGANLLSGLVVVDLLVLLSLADLHSVLMVSIWGGCMAVLLNTINSVVDQY